MARFVGQLRGEHDAEVGGIPPRELHVGDSECMEARGRIARLGEARHALDVSAETVEPLLRHGGNEGGAVLEVPLRRCMGPADAPGYLAQGELRPAAPLDQGEARFYQGL